MIFVTIPSLLILKHLDDDDKGICKAFFPPMFQDQNSKYEDGDGLSAKEREIVAQRFKELKKDYIFHQQKAKSDYDYYNQIEKCVLEIDETSRSSNDQEILNKMGLDKEDLIKIVQQIRVISM